jgi:hypothetical protein
MHARDVDEKRPLKVTDKGEPREACGQSSLAKRRSAVRRTTSRLQRTIGNRGGETAKRD